MTATHDDAERALRTFAHEQARAFAEPSPDTSSP